VNGIGEKGDLGTHLDLPSIDAVDAFFGPAGSNPSERVNP
jgi:hypothetical protein